MPDGDNLTEPLVLYRVHPGQASQARSGLQRAFQERVSLREIGRVAPDLPADRAELARRVGAGLPIEEGQLEDAATAFVELVRAFELSLQQAVARGKPAREVAGRTLARLAFQTSGRARGTLLRHAATLDPLLSTHAAIRRTRRLVAARSARVEAAGWLSELRSRRHAAPAKPGLTPRAIRVTAVFPEPTPYRAPLLDRVAAQPEIDLTVIYAAETVAGRTWRIDPRHRAVFLRGARSPARERSCITTIR